jgi:hypothetical protein
MKLKQFNEFILEIEQSPYPPYHKGYYLERYFIDFYIKNRKIIDDTGYQFLPITWTDIYIHKPHLRGKLQEIINSLDKEKKYFTVSQHDDAPLEILPPHTVKFSAGGNASNCVPIPLICSPIENIEKKEKDIFCSFVGSVNAPVNVFGEMGHNTRMKMLNNLKDKPEYILKPRVWQTSIEESRKNLFLDLTSRSKFTLCPRGYGATSFRLYEAMQLNSIPVYIYYDKPYLPYKDKIDWNSFCVLINFNDIDKLDEKLKSITEETYDKMLNKISEIYQKYFTFEGMCNRIIETLQESI